MRFILSLSILRSPDRRPLLTLNYQYPLSSAIYKIIQRADSDFAAFLHNTGYGEGNRRFKLFTFSDLRTPFQIIGDKMHLTGRTAELVVCFHVPEAAGNFITGLFMHKELEVADFSTKIAFVVQGVQVLPDLTEKASPEEILQEVLSPISPVVCGRKNEKGNYDYLSPDNPAYSYWLINNWKEKYQSVYGSDAATTVFRKIQLKVLPSSYPAKPRLVTIKAGTPAETKIKGYVKFELGVKAPCQALKLLLNSGIGIHNAQGMGCMNLSGKN